MQFSSHLNRMQESASPAVLAAVVHAPDACRRAVDALRASCCKRNPAVLAEISRTAASSGVSDVFARRDGHLTELYGANVMKIVQNGSQTSSERKQVFSPEGRDAC